MCAVHHSERGKSQPALKPKVVNQSTRQAEKKKTWGKEGSYITSKAHDILQQLGVFGIGRVTH